MRGNLLDPPAGGQRIRLRLPSRDHVVTRNGSERRCGNAAHTGLTWQSQSASQSGIGVYGKATNTVGMSFGGRFESASIEGRGVYGKSSRTTGATYGVFGVSDSDTRTGVYGYAHAGAGPTYGVYGIHTESGNYGYLASLEGGVYGEDGGSGNYGALGSGLYAVYGRGIAGSDWAGYFNGDVNVTGSFSKGSGSFLIDYPLDPENRLLRYNFVESPENLLIYRGSARLDENGQAVVKLPDHFIAVSDEEAATIHLTPVGKPFLTGYEWNGAQSSFTAYGDSSREISWMVMADRDDPVMRQLRRPIEEEKGPESKYCDRGKLLYPDAYGYPETMAADQLRRRVQMER